MLHLILIVSNYDTTMGIYINNYYYFYDEVKCMKRDEIQNG